MVREKPKQDRAAATVDYIAEATIQLLDVDQDPNFTTNHIAERAGVSVGTLYRYFPDKGAILRFLVRREARRATDKMLDLIERSEAETGPSFLSDVLELSVSIFGQRAKATHTIRELAQKDEMLVAEVARLRLSTARLLHDRLMELEPSRFPAISDIELEVVCEAFKAAILTLGRHSQERTLDRATCSRLVTALLGAVPET